MIEVSGQFSTIVYMYNHDRLQRVSKKDILLDRLQEMVELSLEMTVRIQEVIKKSQKALENQTIFVSKFQGSCRLTLSFGTF